MPTISEACLMEMFAVPLCFLSSASILSLSPTRIMGMPNSLAALILLHTTAGRGRPPSRLRLFSDMFLAEILWDCRLQCRPLTGVARGGIFPPRLKKTRVPELQTSSFFMTVLPL
jgi:hypothetical protein